MVRHCAILGGFFSSPRRNIAQHDQNKEPREMRLKLVIAASVLAAVVGAGSCIALVLGVFSAQALSKPGLLAASTILLPIATIVIASIFVYRHTARRRKLQAALTVIISLVLTITFFVIGWIVTSRINPIQPEPGNQRNTT